MKKVLEGCEFYWVKLKDVDEYSCWSLKCFLSPAAVSKLKEGGVGDKIKTDTPNKKGNVDKEGELCIRLRKKKTDDRPNPPRVFDSNMVAITDMIGNGSKGNVQVDIYEYKEFGGGIAVRLEAVQVTHLIIYEAGEEFGMLEEETTVDKAVETTVEEKTSTPSTDDNPF